ncbi:hypothetical protein PIB30_026771 [Stylosanthes scabra]|uniref:Aminotransferase-like plant mobile domain-containing protein n=1 Tax=Stylosanthes scabra TaxID=79078 RepID=A0ABU6XAK2_9FABA|nr:hypothetical protein [Stylosanthes scabra]
MASSGNQTTLKRRLDFDLEEVAPNERFINIWQRGYGSPFTVYAYKGMDMVSEDTPECLDLVFWPPRGMTFAGFELIVATYIFSNGLDMSGILVPDFLARGTREMLWFYKDKSSFRLKPSEFDFIEPQVGQQQPLSGVWVCLWMIESHQCTNFDLEVSDATRMTIALNLVTYEYNQIGDMISERAVHYWDLEMIKSQKK